MTIYDYLEIGISIALYIPLNKEILKGELIQNFATWSLWTLLDGIETASLMRQHGNYTAVAVYTIGGAITAYCILKSGNSKWTKFETFVTCMAFACIAIWTISGAKNAAFVTTIAVLIAAAPTIKETYQEPWKSSLLTWIGFMIVNIIGTIQGKAWTIEERFYPAACGVLCLLLIGLTARKLWIPKPTPAEQTK